MKMLLAIFLFLAVAGGTYYLWFLLDKNNKQNAAGAEKCYEQGENFFKQQKYKEALWSYEEVSEFYSKPHTNWADLAQEKEWICRAYLNDWTPSKAKTTGDMRELKPHLYQKYKAELISITPVVEGMGNTMTPVGLTQTPGLATTPTHSVQPQSLTTPTADLTPTPAVTTISADSNQTPTLTTTTADLTQTPTTTSADLTPTPSPAI